MTLDPKDEGITHVNLKLNSNTEVGKWLCPFHDEVILTPHGKFKSLNAYYHYLKFTLSAISGTWELTQPMRNDIDALRKQDSIAALRLARRIRLTVKARGLEIAEIPSTFFNMCYEQAVRSKLVSNQDRLGVILEWYNKVPFTNYTVLDDGQVVDEERMKWVVDRITHVLDELK